MEQILRNTNLSAYVSLCLKILLCGNRIKGLLSLFLFYFHSLCNFVYQKWKAWTRTRSSNSEPQKQSLDCNIEWGAKLCREEVIRVMGNLGINVERDGDGIKEVFDELDIAEVFEEEPSLAEVKEAFDVFDDNKDGFIDAKDLHRILNCLGLKKDMEECKRMISAVDQNGDELVDHNEFVKFMEQSCW